MRYQDRSISIILDIFEKKIMSRVSVISGGTSGLGLEIAALLFQHGKDVIILGRDKNKQESSLAKLKSISGKNKAEALTCNIGNENDIKKLSKYLRNNSLTVEYLFNNAGTGLFIEADKSTEALIDKVFEANLKGMILLTSEVLSITPEEDELTIVNIMSTSALVGRAEETIYCAAKWGARGYTEALRTELKGTKRNIIAVYPGGMKTDFWNIPGQSRDISSFMDPVEVAEKIVHAVMVTDKMYVTDITINRKIMFCEMRF
jgi:short-subunit dehydrogenase